MKQQTFTGRKKDGDFKIYRRKDMQDLIDTMEDGEYEFTISEKKKKRSLPQLRYYRGCVIPAVYDGLVDLGYAKKDLTYDLIHEMLKDKFLFKEIVNEDSGEVMRVPKSTSECTTSDMMEYIDNIQRWSAEILSINIPDANTQSNLDI